MNNKSSKNKLFIVITITSLFIITFTPLKISLIKDANILCKITLDNFNISLLEVKNPETLWYKRQIAI